MKKLSILLLVFAFCAPVIEAGVRFGGGAHAGLTFSSFPDPMNQYYGTGFGVGLNGDLNIIEPLAIRVDAEYSRFSSDKNKLSGLFTVTDGAGNPVPFEVTGLDASIFSVTTSVLGRIPTGSVVRPYGILGVGLYVLSMSNLKLTSNGQTLIDQSPDNTSTRFGLDFGAGTEFLVGPARLFVEAKYNLIFTEGSTTGTIPLTFGVAF